MFDSIRNTKDWIILNNISLTITIKTTPQLALNKINKDSIMCPAIKLQVIRKERVKGRITILILSSKIRNSHNVCGEP